DGQAGPLGRSGQPKPGAGRCRGGGGAAGQTLRTPSLQTTAGDGPPPPRKSVSAGSQPPGASRPSGPQSHLRCRKERRPPSPPRRSGRGGPLPGDGGERARPWTELLRAASADLSPDGELPPLPAFPGPEPGGGPERSAAPEVFTVGGRTFPWTPFPPAPRGGGDPGRSSRVLLGARGRSGCPARSPQRRPAPEPRGTPGAREQLWEAAPTLRSCPMCQADFAPGLDVDHHLAQCLAESAEDVVW
ncbi:Fanconi anemia core complex-associated protein 20, partial [Mustela nigripes]|uniref:Fanconi anemia core complex-associated protein 20 n=1 Tax=Mustela nigripes TaxID=77151 RepID=UPI0028153D66